MERMDRSSESGSFGRMTFIGNATVLFRLGDFVFLTDPSFIHKHEQTWLGYGLQTTRLTDPAMELSDLPPLDFVLLSHFHGDHFDQVAERELPKDLPIVTPPASAKELADRGFTELRSLDEWASLTIGKGKTELRITATPGRHGPPLSNYVLPDVMGSVVDVRIEGRSEHLRIYITGDTLVIDDLAELPRRFPDIDLALLHLGGTEVFGIMVTMDGEQGVRMIQMVNPARAMPIHFDDYDVFKSPLSDFQRAVDGAGLGNRVRYWQRGDTVELYSAGT
jgi:L-ascorbate metabolism protein UlaG (beta-lactamase superfamily)